MQCNETHLRCFLFIAQRLVIGCICITMHCMIDIGLRIMQCTETHVRCFLFIAQRVVIACICITRNKLDYVMQCNETHLRYFHCTEVSYCVHTHNEEQVIYVMQCDETNLCVFFSLHRG